MRTTTETASRARLRPSPEWRTAVGDGAAGRARRPRAGAAAVGQGTFRVAVTQAYRRQCAITRERALPALEAAHMHITVTPELRVEASRPMREDFDDGENYVRLHGSAIWVPERAELRPDPEVLAWHNEQVYRG